MHAGAVNANERTYHSHGGIRLVGRIDAVIEKRDHLRNLDAPPVACAKLAQPPESDPQQGSQQLHGRLWIGATGKDHFVVGHERNGQIVPMETQQLSMLCVGETEFAAAMEAYEVGRRVQYCGDRMGLHLGQVANANTSQFFQADVQPAVGATHYLWWMVRPFGMVTFSRAWCWQAGFLQSHFNLRVFEGLRESMVSARSIGLVSVK
jgi:hypothetical protein